jgi:hypothetical protein
MLDSAIAPADALTFPWPRPESLRDLAHARLLPIRQAIGQFLSGYSPAVLAEGLRSVRVRCHGTVCAEGTVMKNWVRERLLQCGISPSVTFETETKAELPERSFELRFDYASANKTFVYTGDLAHQSAQIEADFGSGKVTLPAAAGLLSPEAALGEAMFF